MESHKEMSQWLKKNLQELLPCLVSDDLVEYIMAIEDFRDFEEYMNTLTDVSSLKYQELVAKYKKLKSNKEKTEDIDEKYAVKPKSNKKGNFESSSNYKKNGDAKVAEKQKQKKKTKFVNLYSSGGNQKGVILLKGRHLCECQATKHKLINNCLNCGRIVCEQEGSGPCLFCSNEVFSKEELEIINSNTKKSRRLYNALMKSSKSDVDKAVEARDKLIECDRSFSQRTQVIDDQSDYYSCNSAWLSKEQREKLEKKNIRGTEAKKCTSRQEKKNTRFWRLTPSDYKDEPQQVDENSQEELINKIETALSQRYVNPDVRDLIEVKYVDTDVDNPKTGGKVDSLGPKNEKNWHIQDQELMEMYDNGYCLSVHQPWASLLVAGIKTFEGRTWYTSHRGRLWIASASKQPTKEEIKEAENFFKAARADEKINFPKSYPTGCLLGCVSVTDCIPGEEFKLNFAGCECDSPFVLICEDPRRLNTLFRVSGGHKLYKLDPKISVAANKILLHMSRNS